MRSTILRWLDPKLTTDGGGHLRYQMHLWSDSAEFAVSNVDVRYERATVAGNADVVLVSNKRQPTQYLVRGTDLTFANVSTALVKQFAPSAPLRRQGTLGGHVVAKGTLQALDIDADVRFDDAAAGTSRVIARGSAAFANGFSTRGLHVSMLPVRLATVRGLGVNVPLGGVVTGETQVSGAMRSGWNVTGDLTHVDAGATSHVIGSGDYRVSGKRLTADATLEPLSLATVGRFAPKAELRGSVTGKVHAEGTTRDLHVSGNVRSTSGGGAVNGTGAVSIAGSRTRYDVSIRADALDAHAFTLKAPRTLLTGTISARGTGVKPATMNAVMSADLVKSRYDTFSVDRLLARGSIASGLAHVDTLAVFERGASVRARGSFGVTSEATGTLAFSASVDSLGTLRPWIGVKDTTSVAAASARQTALFDRARADSVRRAEAVRIERLALGLPEGVSIAPDTIRDIRARFCWRVR